MKKSEEERILNLLKSVDVGEKSYSGDKEIEGHKYKFWLTKARTGTSVVVEVDQHKLRHVYTKKNDGSWERLCEVM